MGCECCVGQQARLFLSEFVDVATFDIEHLADIADLDGDTATTAVGR